MATVLYIFLEYARTKMVFFYINTLRHIIATVNLAFEHLYHNLCHWKYYLSWQQVLLNNGPCGNPWESYITVRSVAHVHCIALSDPRATKVLSRSTVGDV